MPEVNNVQKFVTPAQFASYVKPLRNAVREQTSQLSDDVKQLVEYKQVEQEYQLAGEIVSDNWDDVGDGGYYDGNGKWTPNSSYRWCRINAVREDYELYTTVVTGADFIHVFDGEPSEGTFVAKYRTIDNNLPTEINKAVIPKGCIVIVQNTVSSVVKVVCNNKSEYAYGEKLSEIEEAANSAKETADTVDAKAEKALAMTETIAPSVEKDGRDIATFSTSEYIGEYIIGDNGSLNSYAQYHAYKYNIDKNGKFYAKDFGDSGYCFLGYYNGEPSVSTFVRRINGKTISDFVLENVNAGDCVVISCYNISESFNFYLDYAKRVIPTLFIRDKNIAWFGDSISQLQLLPHRVAEYIGCTVNDCSFAGAPLTYGTEAYQGTGFMSLSSQIVSGDFSELESALSKQTSVTEDKRGNADRLEALDFSKITDIVVMAGTNDVNNDYVATSTDLTKFKNGMRTAIENILDNFPHIVIRFISNPYRGDVIVDKHGNSLADFVNAEKEVCAEYNIPYYDLLHNCGIDSHNVEYYLMNDNLHQNENGDILLAQKCAKWLMSN